VNIASTERIFRSVEASFGAPAYRRRPYVSAYLVGKRLPEGFTVCLQDRLDAADDRAVLTVKRRRAHPPPYLLRDETVIVVATDLTVSPGRPLPAQIASFWPALGLHVAAWHRQTRTKWAVSGAGPPSYVSLDAGSWKGADGRASASRSVGIEVNLPATAAADDVPSAERRIEAIAAALHLEVPPNHAASDKFEDFLELVEAP
jgi:hypothetical protein